MFFAMHPMKFCKWHNAELEESELCLQSQENVKMPLKSMADMKKEDGIVESNVIHIRTMTMELLFFHRCILGKTIRLQHLVGNPGIFQPTSQHVKAALREAMSSVEHDWFLLAFNKGDKWKMQHKENHKMHKGNKDSFIVKLTVEQLDELHES